jgi:hypothetical protein
MLKRFKKLSKRNRILVAAAAAIAFFVVGLSGGCVAYRRPPAPSDEEQALLRNPPLPYTVTVAWCDEQTKTGQDPGAYACALARAVASSGAFKSNRYEQSSAPSGQVWIVDGDARFVQRFRLAVIRRGGDIERLVKRSP